MTAADRDEISTGLADAVDRVARSVVGVHDGAARGGSGVIWGRNLVMTNHHVVPGHEAVVRLADGEERPARVVGRDRQHDLVALRVDGLPEDAIPATVRDASSLRVGEMVFAIGNPLGLHNAPALGVVCGDVLGRGQEVLQVALSLRPGNSGGALADLDGQVVGVPHMVVGGLGLAVPSDVVNRFLADVDRPAEPEVRWV